MKISCIQNFQQDLKLKEEILNLTKPSYTDPGSVLTREYKNNSKVYLLRNAGEELIAFFMTGIDKFDELEINYLGLACVKDEYKNTGLIVQLFLRGIEDAIHNNAPKICWLTTPSTQIFKMIHCMLDFVSPGLEMEYSSAAYDAVLKIQACKGYGPESENPFIVRGAAQLTQYSAKEIARINRHKKDRISRLFDKVALNEQNGDRLIMVCNVPGIEKLHLLKQKFRYLNSEN